MKYFRLILITLLILVLGSGLSARKNDRALRQLQHELQKLKNIRAEGIVQVNHQQFALRKSFVLAKNENEIRIDVVEGGVMGMQAEPIFSIYMSDYIALRSPMIPQLELFDLNRFVPGSPGQMISALDSLVLQHQEEIISRRKLELDNVTLTFNKDYQITEVIDKESNMTLSITYNRRKTVDIISIKEKGKELLSLMIDKISHEPQEIVPI
ncbi:MAG: hypothetical protein U1C33_02935, partial [Candidatus Cloacimonadaceae bacterium]|nr:hypothetical protein [Candidatus Cloacimonadaceae bacterium]